MNRTEPPSGDPPPQTFELTAGTKIDLAVDCVAQVAWLGRVLTARAFPIDRLVHHVELTATLLRTVALGHTTDRAAERMADAASQLRLQYAA